MVLEEATVAWWRYYTRIRTEGLWEPRKFSVRIAGVPVETRIEHSWIQVQGVTCTWLATCRSGIIFAAALYRNFTAISALITDYPEILYDFSQSFQSNSTVSSWDKIVAFPIPAYFMLYNTCNWSIIVGKSKSVSQISTWNRGEEIVCSGSVDLCTQIRNFTCKFSI
jgi:hypothetical protein